MTQIVTASHANAAWTLKNKRIKFTLGGLLLYSTRVRALVLDGYFAGLPLVPDDEECPLGLQPAEVRAALITSRPVAAPLPRISLAGKSIRYAPHQYRRFHLEVQGTFTEYLKRFTSRRRTYLRRIIKNLAVNGIVDWREYSRPEEMNEYYELARAVSEHTYQENMADAGLPAGEAFVSELVERARRDAVRGYILFFEGRPIAYQYCPAEGGVLIYERVGYDSVARHLSPGTGLLYLVIERLFETGRFRSFDFGAGEFPYKESFSTGHTLCADIYYFRRTLRNAALVAAHCALNGSSGAINAALDRLGVRNKLKKLVHQRYGAR